VVVKFTAQTYTRRRDLRSPGRGHFIVCALVNEEREEYRNGCGVWGGVWVAGPVRAFPSSM